MSLQSEQIYNKEEDEIDLLDLITPLFAYFWHIVVGSLLVSFLTYLYFSSIKPSFKATATLHIINKKQASSLSINEAFNKSSVTKEQMKTQYEFLRSRKLAERIIRKLNLIQHDEFSTDKYKIASWFHNKKKNQLTLETMVNIFQSRLSIEPIVDTELVKISFIASEPGLAELIANQVGYSYLEFIQEKNEFSKQNTSRWLVEQLANLEIKLEASEQSLQTYREEQEIFDIDGVISLISANLKSLTQSMLMFDKQKDELKLTFERIQQSKDDLEQLLNIRNISEHRALIELRRTEQSITRKKLELAKRYGKKHPKMVAVTSEFNLIHQRIIKQAQSLAKAIKQDYLAIERKIKVTQERLDQTKAEFLRLSGLKNKFTQLQRDVRTNQELYNNYLVRLKAADAMNNYSANFDAGFLDKAVTPARPIAPKIKLIIIIAFMLTAIVLSLIVLLKGGFKDSLNSQRKLDNFNEANILTILPFIKSKNDDEDFQSDEQSHFNEAVRTLKRIVFFNSNTTSPKVLGITSSLPNEGKSTIAYQLAKLLSETERVLLIEADLRNPTLAKRLELDVHRPGLSNLIAQTHSLAECIIKVKDSKLNIITSGIIPSNPHNFLSMNRFKKLISSMEGHFDRVIIDTPPVLAVSDTIVIGQTLESLLYIVNSETTSREQISTGLNLLKQANVSLRGVVVNKSKFVNKHLYKTPYTAKPGVVIKWPISKTG